MLESDSKQVLEIYRQGIETGNATFETQPPSWEAFDLGHSQVGRFVASISDEVVGWVAMMPSSQRCAYIGVAEFSVYVSPTHRGKGIGLALLESLIDSAERDGIWTLTSGILRENTASLRLHEKAGFRVIGYQEKVAKLNGVWRDVVRIERRSTVVGTTECEFQCALPE